MNYLKLFFLGFVLSVLIVFIFRFSETPLSDQVGIHKYPETMGKASTGCGKSTSNNLSGTFTYDGIRREYIISLPENYDQNKPTQLIYGFHGRTNTNYEVREYFELEKYSKQPTIFVYPASLKQNNATNTWNNKSTNFFDFTFFDVLNSEITSEYCINLDRIFIVGHSLGASYVNSLACKKANVLRGLGSLGGGGIINECSGNIAAIIIHNPKDKLVPFENANKIKDLYLKNNRLVSEYKKIQSEKFNCLRYGDKKFRFPIVWCPHDYDHTSNGRYYPHTWPDKTGKLIIEFFESLN